MAASSKRICSEVRQFESLMTVILIMFATSQPASARPYKLGDDATARCKNLLPDKTGAVMNGVFVPPGATRTTLVSRLLPMITIQLITGKPLNRARNAKYTVPVAPKLVNAPRILFVLELRSGKSCGCEAGDLCLKTPSLLGYFGYQHCTSPSAPIEESANDVLSETSPPFSEPDYLKQIQMVGSAGHETCSWSAVW